MSRGSRHTTELWTAPADVASQLVHTLPFAMVWVCWHGQGGGRNRRGRGWVQALPVLWRRRVRPTAR